MEFSFGGSYKKYKIVQNFERPNEIDLYNKETGRTNQFLKIHNPWNTELRLIKNTSIGSPKKIKAFINRRWTEFYSNTENRVLINSKSMEEVTTDFLLYVSKSIREFKLEDLLKK